MDLHRPRYGKLSLLHSWPKLRLFPKEGVRLWLWAAVFKFRRLWRYFERFRYTNMYRQNLIYRLCKNQLILLLLQIRFVNQKRLIVSTSCHSSITVSFINRRSIRSSTTSDVLRGTCWQVCSRNWTSFRIWWNVSRRSLQNANLLFVYAAETFINCAIKIFEGEHYLDFNISGAVAADREPGNPFANFQMMSPDIVMRIMHA